MCIRDSIGAVLYALGFGAEYAAVRAGRGVKHLALLGVRGICRFAKDLTETAFPGAAQVVKDLFGPFVLLVKGIVALLIHAHHIHREKGLGAALKASAHYLASGVRRNLRLLPRMATVSYTHLDVYKRQILFRTTKHLFGELIKSL